MSARATGGKLFSGYDQKIGRGELLRLRIEKKIFKVPKK